MDLHKQIMNIRTTSAHIGKAIEAGMDYDNDWESRLALVYKMGHRDAKHAAAELVTIQQATDTILSKIEKSRLSKDTVEKELENVCRVIIGLQHDLDSLLTILKNQTKNPPVLGNQQSRLFNTKFSYGENMKLPYVCPEHPKGQIKHTWDSDIYDYGKYLQKPKKHNHVYECAICGRKLASTLEESSDADR